MSDKWLNASELSEYMYCRRAWWYKHTRKLHSANVRHLESGSAFHRRHGRRLRTAPWLRGIAYLLLFIAVAALVFQLAAGA